MTDYSELKRLAEAAPEGPWFGPEYAPGTSYVFDVDLGTLLAYEGIDSEKDACLRYVAAANPAAVLALIAENERLAGECEGCPMSIAEELRKERDALRSALVEAKYRIEQGRVWAGTKWQLMGLHPLGQQKALDAIDVALSQGERANG